MDFIYKIIANIKNAFMGRNNSLHFRAKLYASLIAIVKEPRAELDSNLKAIINDLYTTKTRQKILYLTTLEYINIARKDILGVDKLLRDVKNMAHNNAKFKRKINFAELDKLVLKKNIKEEVNEIEDYSQLRVIEFLKKEVI